MPEEIIWEDPPNNQVTAGMFDEALAVIKKKPGQWARLRLYDTQSPAYSARKRLVAGAAKTDPKWEVKVARMDGNGSKYGLYVRYRSEEQMKEEK